MLYRAWRWRKERHLPEIERDLHKSVHSLAMRQLRSLNSELGINLQGDPSPEVILRELDPQSMILCGLSPKWNGKEQTMLEKVFLLRDTDGKQNEWQRVISLIDVLSETFFCDILWCNEKETLITLVCGRTQEMRKLALFRI